MFQVLARRSAALAVLVAVSVSAPAGASTKGDPSKKVVCKVERSSTSRIASTRHCKTVGEWEAEQKQREDMAADRENLLLRNAQESAGSLGSTAPK